MRYIKIIEAESKLNLQESLQEIEINKDVRVVILKFADEKLFVRENNFDEELIKQIGNFRIPIITLIEDVAKGFLFEIVLASHLCFASNDSSFVINNKEDLVSQIGLKNIEKLNSIEKQIEALTALDLGVINKILDAGNLETEALNMAEQISKLAPLAIRSCIKAVNKGLEMDLKKGLELEIELFSQIFATEDMKEGTSAFLEKRKAVFRGK